MGPVAWISLFILVSVPILKAAPKRADLSAYRPVTVRDASVAVPRSGVVWIRLPVIPSGDPMLRFNIVTPPSGGTLSKPSLGSDGQWGVFYANAGKKDIPEDSFTFRCQSAGRSNSDRAKVSIVIIPPPPKLSMSPSRIDFGNVLVGDSVRGKVVLKNSGGIPAVGALVLPPGVKAPEGDSFRLSEGEEITLPVEFSPSAEGSISGELSTQPFLGATPVRVVGKAGRRFALSQVSPTRWEISNASSNKLRIWLGNSAAWGLPGDLLIKPGGVAAIVLDARGEDAAAGIPPQGVSVSDGSTTLDIPPPPRIPRPRLERLTPDQQVCCRAGGEVMLVFRVVNPANISRDFRWMIESKSGGGTEGERTVRLPPGGKETISYALVPSVPGSCPVTVRLSDGVSPPQTIVWNVSVASADSKPAPDPTPDPVVRSPVVPDDSPRDLPVSEPVTVPPISGLTYGFHSGILGKKTLEIFFPPIDGLKRVTLHEILPESSSLEKFRKKLENRSPDGATEGAAPIKPEESEITGFRVIEKPDRVSIVLKGVFPGIHSVQVSVWGEHHTPIAQGGIQIAVPVSRPFWMNWKVWLMGFLFLAGVKIMRDRGIF